MPKTSIKKPPVYVISMGCPRNLVDSEVLTGGLKKKGFRIIATPLKNSIAIVNTCAFIEDAKAESVDVILELADLRKKGGIKALIIAGCLSQRYKRSLMDEISQIDGVFGSGNFTEIPQYIEKILKGGKPVIIDKRPEFLYDDRMPRTLFTPRHSVYVKIQEGCMNFCSYCVIPGIRGPFRSRSRRSVLRESAFLKRRGAREINIIGQDTTLYGKDKHKKPMLAPLLKEIAALMKSGWVRLLYTHPAHYTESLIKVIKNEASVCRYLDLPIQHINDKILKNMNRRVTKKDIISLIERLRKQIPDIAIRTSVIVGFPGEGDKEFRELVNFIKEIKFDRLGVFIYSREEGTKAFHFPHQVPEGEKEKRLKEIMEMQKTISEENNKKYMGKTLKVLIDSESPGAANQYLGRTQYDAPEVDGTVYVRAQKPLRLGDFVDVKINDTLEYDLAGEAK